MYSNAFFPKCIITIMLDIKIQDHGRLPSGGFFGKINTLRAFKTSKFEQDNNVD